MPKDFAFKAENPLSKGEEPEKNNGNSKKHLFIDENLLYQQTGNWVIGHDEEFKFFTLIDLNNKANNKMGIMEQDSSSKITEIILSYHLIAKKEKNKILFISLPDLSFKKVLEFNETE